jgi:hypothetical protein
LYKRTSGQVKIGTRAWSKTVLAIKEVKRMIRIKKVDHDMTGGQV